MMKKIIFTCILLFLAVFSYGQSNFARGEELLMLNQPAQAVDFLLRAIAEEPANTLASLYLGIVYEQLGRMDEAIALYRRILPSAGNLSATVANNLGNVYFQRGNLNDAEQFYTQAIGFNPSFPSAYLGRANTRIRAGNLQNAITDYEQYLRLEPNSSRRTNIEQLVSLIQTESMAEEMRRMERQRLLDGVAASLQAVAETSQGISAGAEGVEHYEGEFVLE
jgi:tetratricopeptide (TPR) repeat protein